MTTTMTIHPRVADEHAGETLELGHCTSCGSIRLGWAVDGCRGCGGSLDATTPNKLAEDLVERADKLAAALRALPSGLDEDDAEEAVREVVMLHDATLSDTDWNPLAVSGSYETGLFVGVWVDLLDDEGVSLLSFDYSA